MLVKSVKELMIKVMEPPPDPRGHLPFIPYNNFTPGTPVFTHYTSAR